MFPNETEHGTFVGRRDTWQEAFDRVVLSLRDLRALFLPGEKPVYTIRKGPLGWSYYLRIERTD